MSQPLAAPSRREAISQAEFARFAAWVDAAAGIHLPDRKMPLLQRRLGRRLRELGFASYGDYLELVRRDPVERTRAIDLLTTNETAFFREPKQFELLERTLLPRWRREAEEGRREPKLRAWSTACATGEEPYSLAMLLLDQLGDDPRWRIEILASDLSSRVLERAREAIYPAARVARGVAPERIVRYFLRGKNAQEGFLKVAPEVRELVHFESINLVGDAYPVARGLDMVFCRNVLIYFRPERRRMVVERLLSLLRPGGILFLGHAENLAGLGITARTVIPTVYEWQPAEQEPAAAAGTRR